MERQVFNNFLLFNYWLLSKVHSQWVHGQELFLVSTAAIPPELMSMASPTKWIEGAVEW